MHALPLMVLVLCVMALAYRYYSAFLAAKVFALDAGRPTPAHSLNDGQNYHPTNKWVLFGHHFAAISGAGPLIGPVLAAQFGFLPGLLWLVVGVVLGGAVQDFVILVASMRCQGKSLAEIARREMGPVAGTAGRGSFSGATSRALSIAVHLVQQRANVLDRHAFASHLARLIGLVPHALGCDVHKLRV